MAYTLTATYDNPPSAVLTLTGDSAFSTTPLYRFKIYSDDAGTQLVTSSGWITLSESSTTITYTVASINSGTYYVTAESDDPETYISLQQVVLTDNSPKTATQSQWEDLATRVKAKADSSDVPSTYWGQTASNGAVTGDLTLNTHAAHGDAEITSGATLQDGVSVSLTAGGSDIITARSYTDVQSQVSISTIELGGTIDAGSNQINHLAAGTASTDAVNKSQLDAKPTITMTSTDPGEGAALAANNYVAVYGGDPIIMDYSTSEINTGAKWIDGSTIYKKTINFGALPNATYKTVAHQISNVSRFIKIEQSITNTGGTGALALSSGQASNNDFNFYVTDTNIGITTSGDRSTCNAYITLYYTKSS